MYIQDLHSPLPLVYLYSPLPLGLQEGGGSFFTRRGIAVHFVCVALVFPPPSCILAFPPLSCIARGRGERIKPQKKNQTTARKREGKRERKAEREKD